MDWASCTYAAVRILQELAGSLLDPIPLLASTVSWGTAYMDSASTMTHEAPPWLPHG